MLALRRQRPPGKEIALRAELSATTISRILRAAKLSRAKDLDPPMPANRYEHSKPIAMVHMDVKKLGRFSGIGQRITGDCANAARTVERGWEFVHIAIHYNSRIAFSMMMPDEKQEKAERIITTALAEWAYARRFETLEPRAAELPKWLHRYNSHRSHSAIRDKPAISKLPQTGNNLLRGQS